MQGRSNCCHHWAAHHSMTSTMSGNRIPLSYTTQHLPQLSSLPPAIVFDTTSSDKMCPIVRSASSIQSNTWYLTVSQTIIRLPRAYRQPARLALCRKNQNRIPPRGVDLTVDLTHIDYWQCSVLCSAAARDIGEVVWSALAQVTTWQPCLCPADESCMHDESCGENVVTTHGAHRAREEEVVTTLKCE